MCGFLVRVFVIARLNMFLVMYYTEGENCTTLDDMFYGLGQCDPDRPCHDACIIVQRSMR